MPLIVSHLGGRPHLSRHKLSLLRPTRLRPWHAAVSTDQEAALETVRSRQLTLQGPTPFVQGGYGVIVRRPIFIGGVNDTSGFGMPAPLNPICGAPCAYNNATKSVFWGFVSRGEVSC